MSNPKRHDPDRDAASYLAGAVRGRERQRFEAHLLDCEECWREVDLGRKGRAVAETARELAPALLRDDIRAAVMLSPHLSRRRLVTPTALVALPLVLVLLVTGLFVLSAAHRQPAPIAAALASYRSGHMPGSAPAITSSPDLSALGLRLMEGAHGMLGDMPVDAFDYESASGEHVMVFVATHAFPVARGAAGSGPSMHGWQATDNGTAIMCPPNGHYLLLSSDGELAQRAEQGFV